MLACFLTTENLSIGANEKLLSRKFKIDSSIGGPERETSGKGRKSLAEKTFAERLVWPFLE